jgi:hypothetical protein
MLAQKDFYKQTRIFPLTFYYCKIYPKEGLTLLSQNLLFFLQEKTEDWDFLKSKLNFLISCALENKILSLH